MNFSVICIARNEAETLPRLINSLKEFTDLGGDRLKMLLDTGLIANINPWAIHFRIAVLSLEEWFHGINVRNFPLNIVTILGYPIWDINKRQSILLKDLPLALVKNIGDGKKNHHIMPFIFGFVRHLETPKSAKCLDVYTQGKTIMAKSWISQRDMNGQTRAENIYAPFRIGGNCAHLATGYMILKMG